MIAITVHSKDAADRLQRVMERTERPAGMLRIVGREVGNRLRVHFREKQKTPNKLGGKRTNFWLQVARSVQQPRLKGAAAVVVSINHPAIAQKVRGGRITAKRSRFLTIPVSPEAHGRTAETLAHEKGILLFVLGKPDGQKGVLAELSTTRGIVVHYLLRRSVNQAPDPTALPPTAALAEAAASRAEAALARELSTT